MADIYAVGDGAFLTEVINSLALLTSSDSFIGLSMAGFIVGVLWTAIQSVMSGTKEFKIHYVLIAAISWVALFGSTTDVIVEDVKTANTRVVSNVPFGVAYSGQIISSIGYHLTSLFEQAFSTPKMLEYGYGKNFSVIRTLDTLTSFGPANQSSSGEGDRMRSLKDYLTYCTLKGIDHDHLSASDIAKSGDLINAIHYPHDVYTVSIRIPGQPNPDSGDTYTCNEAHPIIVDDLTGSDFQDQLFTYLATVLEHDDPSGLLTDIYDNGVVLGTVSRDIIIILLNTYIKNILPASIEAKAILEGGVDYYDEMIQQATEQRNDQWEAQRDIFTKTAPVLMTFFESIMYAIAPFLAFIISLGAAGFGFVAQYLKMALWIQLWSPVMAIIYFFTNFAFDGRMDALINTSQIDPYSLMGQSYVVSTAQDWYATGSMLIAATPFITLMLIYGGAQAATSLTRQVQGADHINEKITARDRIQTSPIMTDFGGNASEINHPVRGNSVIGGAGVMPSISTGVMRSTAAKSANAVDKAVSHQFAQSVLKQASAGNSYDHMMNNGYGFSKTESGTMTQQDKVLLSAAKSVSDGLNLSDTERSTLQTQLAGSFGLGISKNLGAANNTAADALADLATNRIAQAYDITDTSDLSDIKSAVKQGQLSQANGDKHGLKNAFGDIGKNLTSRGISPVASASINGTINSISQDIQEMSKSIGSSLNQSLRSDSDFSRSFKEAVAEDHRTGDDEKYGSFLRTANSQSWNTAKQQANSRKASYENSSSRIASTNVSQGFNLQELAHGLNQTNPAQAQALQNHIKQSGLATPLENEYNRLQNHPSYRSLATQEGEAGQNSREQLKTMAAFTIMNKALDEGYFMQSDPSGGKTTDALQVLANSMDYMTGENGAFNPHAHTSNASFAAPKFADGEAVKQSAANNTGVARNIDPNAPQQQYETALPILGKPEYAQTMLTSEYTPRGFLNSYEGDISSFKMGALQDLQSVAASKSVGYMPESTTFESVLENGGAAFRDVAGTLVDSGKAIFQGLDGATTKQVLQNRGEEAAEKYESLGFSEKEAAGIAFMQTGYLSEQYQPEGFEPSFYSTPSKLFNTVMNEQFSDDQDHAVLRDLFGANAPGASSEAVDKRIDQIYDAARVDDEARLSSLSDISPEVRQEDKDAFSRSQSY